LPFIFFGIVVSPHSDARRRIQQLGGRGASAPARAPPPRAPPPRPTRVRSCEIKEY
jgi:hypothetical protein